MAFTPGQQVALAVTPKITSFLSILGSSWIIIEVLTQRTKRENVYNRLLCAMSFFDVLLTVWFFASTSPIPEGTEGVAWAVGNKQTCIAQGFFLQVGIIPPFYNCCLAVYYMMVVKFGATEERLKRNVEPAMHLLAISFGLLTAISGLYLDLYSNADLWCWIAPYPAGCEDSRTYGETTCTRGDNAWIYRWAFYYAPLWFIIVFVTVIIASVYWTVRMRELQSMQNPPGSVTSRMRSSVIVDANECNTTRRSSLINTQAALVMPRSMASRLEPRTSLAYDEADANHVLEVIETFTSAKHQSVEMNSFGSRALFQQSLYYTISFYAAYSFATINRISQQVSGRKYFSLLLLQALFLPLQGFFNVLIYRYAYFFRLKQRNPHMKGWELMRYTWRWSFLGPPPSKRDTGQTREMLDENGGRPSTQPSSRMNTIDETQAAGDEATSIEKNSDVGPVLELLGAPVHVLDDESDPIGESPMDAMVADLLMSYSEYPGTIAEDAVMVVTHYPSMRREDSYSGMATTNFAQLNPDMTSAPQSFPTMIYEPSED